MGDTGTRQTGVFNRLFPRGTQTIAVETYRLSGKFRVIAIVVCLVSNALTWLSMDTVGLHHRNWPLMQIPNNLVLLVSGALGLVIWKGGLPVRRLRQLTFVCITLELVSLLINLSLYGSVGSHMLVVAMLVVLVYRAIFDFRIGAWAFGGLLVGQLVLIVAEATGLIPAQIALAHGPDFAYQAGSRELAVAPFLLGFEAFGFWGVNWMVLRLQHKDRAIRLLRETLAAAEPGKVGRHTGQTLRDTYVIGSLIGVGGMGEVYEGRHQRTRRRVAIKLLHPHMVDDPVLLARFRREAEIAGRVDSDHVVEVIDADVDDGQPFIVLELLEGRSLQACVEQEGSLAPERVAEVMRQIAVGLDAAHEAHVVHRDLKPDNIVLGTNDSGSERVKILDFGISKIRGNATAITREVAIIGTPDYMSPEQAVGHTDEVDHRSDIFSAGAVAYFALAGHRPFRAGSVPAILRRICDEEPTPLAKQLREPGERAEQLAAVVAIAMAKRPDERYPSVSAFAADLSLASEGRLPAAVLQRAATVTRGAPATTSVGDPSVAPTEDTLPASA